MYTSRLLVPTISVQKAMLSIPALSNELRVWLENHWCIADVLPSIASYTRTSCTSEDR